MPFHASCVECEFEVSVETVGEALNRQVDHRRERDSGHLLEFWAERVSRDVERPRDG